MKAALMDKKNPSTCCLWKTSALRIYTDLKVKGQKKQAMQKETRSKHRVATKYQKADLKKKKRQQ